MGLVNRDLMVAHHSAADHVSQLVEAVCEFTDDDVGPEAQQRPEFLELARLARVSWRHESDAYSVRGRLQASEERAQQLALEVERLQSFLDDADAALRSVHASSRWRLIQRLFWPLDKLRGRA